MNSRLIIGFVLISLLQTSGALAQQWTKVGSFTEGPISAMHFFNVDHGLIAFGTANRYEPGTGAIYLTQNGGKTWTKCTIPLINNANILDIFMTDTLNGWAAINNKETMFGNQATILWRTVNGGLAWSEVRAAGGGFGTGVYETPRALIVTNLIGGVKVSIDGGITFNSQWINQNQGITLGVDFVDDLHGVITTYYESGKWARTSDGGITWIETNSSIESWSVYGVKGTSEFYAAPEGPDGFGGTNIDFLHSTDYGATWLKKSVLPGTPTGHTAGIGDRRLYVQIWKNTTQTGIYESKDKGLTWQYLGGPTTFSDRRFVVMEDVCGGSIVYAADTLGNLFKWVERQDHLQYNKEVSHPGIPSCLQSTIPVVIATEACASIAIEDLVIVNDTHNVFTVITSSLPFTFGKGAPQTLLVQFDPHGLEGSFYATLHIKGTIFGVNGRRINIDSTLLLSAWSFLPILTPSPVPNSIQFGDRLLCDPVLDTSITLHNMSCDTIHIDGGPFNVSSEFTLTTFSLPVIIPPDSSVTIKARFQPAAVGQFSCRPTYRLTVNGQVSDMTLSLEGGLKGDRRTLNLSPDVIRSSICDTLVTSVGFTNQSCYPITITTISSSSTLELIGGQLPLLIPARSVTGLQVRYHPLTVGSEVVPLAISARYQLPPTDILFDTTITVTLEGFTSKPEAVYSDRELNISPLSICSRDSIFAWITNTGCDPLQLHLLSVNADNDFKIYLPADTTLFKDDTLFYKVLIDPEQKGLRLASIVYLHDSIRDTLSFNLPVIDGTKILSVDKERIAFGASSFCHEPDTTLYLTNSGCDTIKIFGVTIAGSGFIAEPDSVVLPPGQSQNITVRAVSNSGYNFATLTFTSNSDSAIPPINLSRTAIDKAELDIRLVSPPTAYNGDTLSMSIFRSGASLPIVTPSEIDFELDYNTDLLEYLGTVGPDTVITDGSIFSIRKTSSFSMMPNSVLATINFRIMLTDDTTTPITIRNVKLNSFDPEYERCIASMTDAEAGFTYIYRCGERTISNFLLKRALNITDVRPNPANDKIVIQYSSSSSEPVELEIYDAMGKLVKNSFATTASITVPVQTIGAGIYTARIRQGQESTSRRFIIQR